jgi:hypothetical protein
MTCGSGIVSPGAEVRIAYGRKGRRERLGCTSIDMVISGVIEVDAGGCKPGARRRRVMVANF